VTNSLPLGCQRFFAVAQTIYCVQAALISLQKHTRSTYTQARGEPPPVLSAWGRNRPSPPAVGSCPAMPSAVCDVISTVTEFMATSTSRVVPALKCLQCCNTMSGRFHQSMNPPREPMMRAIRSHA
jgi:hypothetical protein